MDNLAFCDDNLGNSITLKCNQNSNLGKFSFWNAKTQLAADCYHLDIRIENDVFKMCITMCPSNF